MIVRILIACWLISLPILTALRLPAWRSDAALWGDAARRPHATRRTLGRTEQWGQILLRDAAPPLRQPFSTRERPR